VRVLDHQRLRLLLRGTTSDMGLLPQPVHVQQGSSRCILDLPLTIGANNEDSYRVGKHFADVLVARLNLVSSLGLLEEGKQHSVVLEITDHIEGLAHFPYAQEGYVLTCADRGVKVQAICANGLFYGLQSLYQLFPTTSSNETTFDLPELKVKVSVRVQLQHACYQPVYTRTRDFGQAAAVRPVHITHVRRCSGS
jgi:N-acetyl-beta-hexosaminidase